MDKPFNYRALKLMSWQIGGYTSSWIMATATWMLQIHIKDIILCVLVALNLNGQLSSKVNANQLQ